MMGYTRPFPGQEQMEGNQLRLAVPSKEIIHCDKNNKSSFLDLCF